MPCNTFTGLSQTSSGKSQFLFATVRTGTPSLLIALGELVCDKSGVLNLGQEGIMLMGVVVGCIATLTTGNLMLGVMMGIMAGMAIACLFSVLAIQLRAIKSPPG